VEDQSRQSHRVTESDGGNGSAFDKVARASSPESWPGVSRGRAMGTGGGTPPELAGEDARATFGGGKTRRSHCLQDQREGADLIHLKAGTEVGGAALTDEPPASVGRGQGGLPTTLQAGLAELGWLAFRARSLARPRAQDGHFIGFLEVQRTMPQDVEAHAGQLSEKSEQRPGQACSEQVLTLLEGEKLRGFDLCRQLQSLVSTWAFGRTFGVRCLCPGRSCHPAAFHLGFHKTPMHRCLRPNSICASKEPE
jgi:hypothetical protein